MGTEQREGADGEKGGIELEGRRRRRKWSAPPFSLLCWFRLFARSLARSSPPRLAEQGSGDGEKEFSCGFFFVGKSYSKRYA